MAAVAVPLIASGISALAGLFGGKKQATQSNTGSMAQSGQEAIGGGSSTTPNLSPLQQRLAQMFTQGFGDLYNQSQNLSPYAQTNLQQIAGQGNANRQIISNMLAQRGLSYSPAAAAPLTANLLNTGNQMTQFLSQVPLLQRQLQQQALGGLVQGFSVLPTATSTINNAIRSYSGNQQQSGNVNQFGNPLGGLFSGLGAGLFAPNGQGGTNLGSLLGSLFGGGSGQNDLASYYANQGIPLD